MSTYLYARATRRAESNPMQARALDKDIETPEQKQSELAQKIAALVPAEVLVIWGAVLAQATDTSESGESTIGNPTLLKWSLVGGAVLALALFVLPKLILGWEAKDFGRMLVPPLAFLAWTLLTGSTAHLLFGSPWDGIRDGWEWAIGGSIGALMIALSAALTPTTTAEARAVQAVARAKQLAEDK